MRLVHLSRRVPAWLARDIILPFAVTRLVLCLIGWFGFRLLPLAVSFPQAWEIAEDGSRKPVNGYVSAHLHPFVNMWSRWDAEWYVQVARGGYRYAPGVKSNTAFFPLYPVLLRAAHVLLLNSSSYASWFIAGIVLSNICLLVALVFLRALLIIDFEPFVATRAVSYLLIFPTSFFLSSAYSESLFLALSIAAFYYGRRARWLPACALAALAALTRSQGIIVAGALLIEYLDQRSFASRKIGADAAAFLLVPAAICWFGGFLCWKFGNWQVMFESQRSWQRQLMLPIHPWIWFVRNAPSLDLQHHDAVDFAFLLLLVVAGIAALPRLRWSYTAYIWLAVLFFSSWGTLISVPRFDLVVFPLFVLLAVIGSRHAFVEIGYVNLASLLLALFMVMNSQWNWVA